MTIVRNVQQRLHLFSSDQYERMAELGIVPETGIELINGVIVEMSPKGDRHAYVVSQLNTILTSLPNKTYRVYCEALSLRALPGSTPDPDIALARLGRSYARERPRADEVALIIDVANSSYGYDSGEKKAIYAAAQIPEYWIVDVRAGRDAIERFSHPQAGEYSRYDVQRTGAVISPIEFRDVAIDLDFVFGSEKQNRFRGSRPTHLADDKGSDSDRSTKLFANPMLSRSSQHA